MKFNDKDIDKKAEDINLKVYDPREATREISEYFGGTGITKHHPQVLKLISDYMTRNADALSTPLLEVVVFGNGERRKFLQAYNIDEGEFRAFARTHRILKLGWDTPNDPLSLALLLSFLHTGKREFLEFLGVKFLTGLMYKYYTKNGSLNPGIMRFILYGVKDGKPVMSQKYLLKSEGSSVGMVKAVMRTVAEDFIQTKFKKDELLIDDVIVYILMSIRTRMNLNMRGVRDLYDQYKDERMYDQKDIRDEETNITVENETVKIASLKASISEKINRGLDMNLIKRTNNLYYYEEFKVVYADHLNDVINYCHYLVDFYAEKAPSLSFEAMKRNFVSVVNRAKGIDDTFPEQMKSEYQIRGREWSRAFSRFHIVLIYDIIIRMD